MPQLNISLKDEQLRALEQRAAVEGRPVTVIIQEAVDRFLARQADDDAWRARLDAVVGRIRAGIPPGVTPEEIEADITAARDEVRQAHRARGR